MLRLCQNLLKIALESVNESHCTSNLTAEPKSKVSFAYRSGHSTETSLLRVKSVVMNVSDNRWAIFLVLLDLSAAFTTIDYLLYLVY